MSMSPINAVELLPVGDVYVVGKRRALVEKSIAALAESIKRIGLQTPITVRGDANFPDPETGEVMGAYVLVAGHHRLEAYRRLGIDRIPAVVRDCDEVDAELWEIAENLHRADLTALERDEQVARWVDLAAVKARQVDEPLKGGRQPKEKGQAKAARELGISEPDVRRAARVASISERAKAAARDAGLDDNRTALLAASRETSEDGQVAAIRNYKPVSRAPAPLNEAETQEQWLAAMMRLWNRAPDDWRASFLGRVAS